MQMDSELNNNQDRNNQNSLGIIILAGGKSSRMKSNKVFLNILGEPLIKRVVNEASKVSNKIIVSIGRNDNENDFTSILPKWVKLAYDKADIKSPLNGMLAGIEIIKTDYVLILAVDIPFVNADVIKRLQIEANGFDLAIPLWPNGNIEPLYAVYNVPISINVFRESLKKDEVRIKDVIQKFFNINYVPVEKFKDKDANLNCFININTPKDLRYTKKIAELKENHIN